MEGSLFCLLLLVTPDSLAQLQFSSDNDETGKSANIKTSCMDWKNEPENVLWSALVKGKIVSNLSGFRCKTEPSYCQNSSRNTFVQSCFGCNHHVEYGSEETPLVFTPIKNTLGEVVLGCSKRAFSSRLRPFTLGFKLSTGEENKAKILKWFRDGTITSGCDCVMPGSSNLRSTSIITIFSSDSSELPLGAWGSWSPCSRSCGVSTRSRSRHSGVQEEVLEARRAERLTKQETERCNLEPCEDSPIIFPDFTATPPSLDEVEAGEMSHFSPWS